MIPWIRLMCGNGVCPRILADDLMFTATGVGHRARTIIAMHVLLTQAGSRPEVTDHEFVIN